MTISAHKTAHQNHAVSWSFSRSDCNGKEKDYESGFHYYGARYYWSELLTGWLSVDPMLDKYPSLSPYNYCAWNPVKLVDPNGEESISNDDIVIRGNNNSSITIKTDAINLEINTTQDFEGNQVISDLSHVAIGYEGGVNGTAAAVFGTSYSGYAQNVMFLGGDYAGYWYTYAGGEAQMNGSTAVEASIGVQANCFIAIHDSKKGNVTPSSFSGKYFGAQCGGQANFLGGVNVNVALSQSADKQWTMLSIGVSLSAGPQFGVGVSAGAQIGGTKLLTSEIPTRQRSVADRFWNKLTHKKIPVPGLLF
ncbi:MAG: hypothetical protein K6E93_08190 [Bacteroidales bacterium]|nr:hypothetical protein [Bacteroidales bacterium]